MERIQAAIAKARESRRGTAPAPRPAEPGTPRASVQEAWDALPMHRLDPDRMERNRILMSSKGAEGAAFDVMRTRTLKLMQANGWKRLVITSPTAGCGKSTVLVNLGLSLTRRADVSAILVEADMRRPSLARKLGIDARHSAASMLRGAEPFDRHACRIAERLAVSTNLSPVANPSDLLQGPQVPEVLRGLETRYAPTVMLFDMPPLLVNDDTIGFLQNADCAMIVAEAEFTSIEDIDACERELAAHTNVLGIVLNKCRFSDDRYGYEYY